MKIAIASDHAAFALKEHLKRRLMDYGHKVIDFGCNDERPCDYPDHGRPAAEAVSKGHCDRAVLICGTGIGMSIVANKVPGVYAALCSCGLQAEYSRRHNNSNVLVMGGRMIGVQVAEEILHRWLDAEFEEGRHRLRVNKVEG